MKLSFVVAVLIVLISHAQSGRSRKKRATGDEPVFDHQPGTMCRDFAVDLGVPCPDIRLPTARWGYNTASRVCEEFEFQGCGGNINNFPNFVDCHKFCVERDPPRSADFILLMEHPTNTWDEVRPYIVPGEQNGVFKRAFWQELACWHEVSTIRIERIETIKEPGEDDKIRVSWRIAKEARLHAGESAQLVLSKLSSTEGLTWVFQADTGNQTYRLLRDTAKVVYNDSLRDVKFRTEITVFVIISIVLSLFIIVTVCVLCGKIRRMAKEMRSALDDAKKGVLNAGFEHD